MSQLAGHACGVTGAGVGELVELDTRQRRLGVLQDFGQVFSLRLTGNRCCGARQLGSCPLGEARRFRLEGRIKILFPGCQPGLEEQARLAHGLAQRLSSGQKW